MPEFQTARRVPHSAAEMFDLVADVEHYPEFVPLCQRLVVRSRAEDEEGREVIDAVMTAAYGPLHESFASRVTLDRPALKILVEYLEGPFERLENRWRFLPAEPNQCDVEFYIAYEFRSRMLGAVMGGMFSAAFRRFSEAFARRADALYGVSQP